MHDKNLQEILEQARFLVQEIDVDEAYRLFKVGGRATFVDIREPEELSLGYIKGCRQDISSQTRKLQWCSTVAQVFAHC